MVDIDLRYFWSNGWAIFTGCFVPSGLVIRYLVLHPAANTSRWWRLAASLAMAFASWMFVVGFPVAIVAEVLAHNLVLDGIPTGRADPYSWISVLFLSGLVSTAVEMLVARIFFKRKLLRPAVGLLFAIDLSCVGVAAYATARYVLAHPPIHGILRRGTGLSDRSNSSCDHLQAVYAAFFAFWSAPGAGSGINRWAAAGSSPDPAFPVQFQVSGTDFWYDPNSHGSTTRHPPYHPRRMQ
jgi:hypothetical protein